MDTNELLLAGTLIAAGIFIVLYFNSGKKAALAAPVAGVTEAANNQSEEAKNAERAEKEKAARAALEQLKVPSNLPDVVFYFGSQTGTAEKLCGHLDEDAHQVLALNSRVVDFNDFSAEEFPTHKLVVLCTATHYEGDPCDNTKKFFKWIKSLLKKKESQPFKGMAFAMFGLGDTSYEMYNEMGKFFDDAFESLGAERLYKLGVGNAETFSTEDDFAEWKVGFWPALCAHYAKSDKPTVHDQLKRQQSMDAMSKAKENGAFAQPAYLLVNPAKVNDDELAKAPLPLTMKQYKASVYVPIKSIRQLRQKTDHGSTLEVVFDLKNTGLSYKTAANLVLFPENSPEDVQKVADALGLSEEVLDRKVCFQANPNSSVHSAKMPFPVPKCGMKVREILARFVDLRGQVSTKMFKQLAAMTDGEEKKELLEVAKSKSEHEKMMAEQVGLINILRRNKKLAKTMTIEVLFNSFEGIKPRYYTIASSPVMHPEDLHIAVSLTQIRVPSGATKFGRTSAFFDRLGKSTNGGVGTMCRLFVKDSTFIRPDSHSTPIIMCGPGTGVVPFLGFMQDRELHAAKQGNKETALGDALLYFGCRDKDSDFIYRDDMARMQDIKAITGLHVALSRQPGQKKAYVQDLIRAHTPKIKDLMNNKGAHFFICGSKPMGSDVQNLLKEILGEASYKNMDQAKRLIKELW